MTYRVFACEELLTVMVHVPVGYDDDVWKNIAKVPSDWVVDDALY